MIFTSGTQELQGRTVSHDPTPWRGSWSVNDPYRMARKFAQFIIYDPRPEFAITDNPILAELRYGFRAAHKPDYRRELVRQQLGALAFGEWIGDATWAQRDHAKRVLTRLESLADDELRP